MSALLGIFREISHSPKREFDDAQILRLTGEKLSKRGCNVILKQPDEFLKERTSSFHDLIFMMCEESLILQKIQTLESQGLAVVNSTEAILNTYRGRMIPILQSKNLASPQSWFISLNNSESLNSEGLPADVWVKRGDFHSMQTGDVCYAKTAQDVKNLLQIFHARGIKEVVLQRNIVGDLVKFYGVGCLERKEWFRWFYHKDQNLKRYSFSEEKLKKIVSLSASVLGVEVYGGDAIINKEGEIFVIDLNAWPSFALFREEASNEIAQHLISKIELQTALK